MGDFLRRLTRQMAAASYGDKPDGELVQKAIAGCDKAAALEAIVRRHGAMVYRVCWRVLQQPHDTEDAFQATFLVLAEKLRSIKKQTSLASWLHGVAYRVAVRAKDQAQTRRRREAEVAVGDGLPKDDLCWNELRSALDSELARLPQELRQPLTSAAAPCISASSAAVSVSARIERGTAPDRSAAAAETGQFGADRRYFGRSDGDAVHFCCPQTRR
jgi:RNA polymerase sigma factor (sigma-70 family)